MAIGLPPFRPSPAGTRRRPPRALLFGLALLCGLAGSHDALALKPHVRDGVLFGVAVGVSPGKVSLFPNDEDLAVSTAWKAGVTPQLRLGYALVKNRLVVSLMNQQWLYEQGILAEDKLRINVQDLSLAVNYYPGNPYSMAGGLSLQAGVGVANGRLTLLEPVENDPHGNKFEEVFKRDESGTSYHLGLSYEFRLIDSIAAGLSVAYVYQTIGSEIFDDASSVPMNLTLNWYW
jgi:hypothetical protein